MRDTFSTGNRIHQGDSPVPPVSLRRAGSRWICFFSAICAASVFAGAQPVFSKADAGLGGGAPKYKKYVRHVRKAKLVPLVRFRAVRDSVRIQILSPDSGKVTTELVTALQSLYDDGSGFAVTTDGFATLGQKVSFSSIRKVTDSVYRDPNHSSDKIVTVILWTELPAPNRPQTGSAFRALSEREFDVPPGGFIRGSVINFKGDVIVNGEVNHSVIAFGGNIKVGVTGVVRDHVVALGGNVTISKGSIVYGYILPQVSGHRVRRPERPWTAERQRLSFVPSFTYNRVDGFAPRIGWRFTDADSLLPEMKLTYGIAATSERQRYRFNAHQPLFGASGLSVNGTVYQELKSDDDYLIPEWQNTLYSLLSTTDYKNYYEARGGAFGVQYSHFQQFKFAAEVYTDQLKAIRSARDIWSLFGGDKRFYPNYQGIPSAIADSARAEFDDKRSAGIILTVSARSRKVFKSRNTHWRARGIVEKTLSDLDSDFSFTRFSLEGEHERSLTRFSTLSVRGQFNASSGVLPLYRKFFLGGYRWLRGFNHKEFSGSKSWAAALDYGVSFKGAGLNFLKFWMFYDAGQVADANSFGDSSLLQSLGLGLAIDDYVRLNFARRLDKSDPSWRIAVEF